MINYIQHLSLSQAWLLAIVAALVIWLQGNLILGFFRKSSKIKNLQQQIQGKKGLVWNIGFHDTYEVEEMVNRTLYVPDLVGAALSWARGTKGLYGIIIKNGNPYHVCINYDCLTRGKTILYYPGSYKIRASDTVGKIYLVPHRSL